METDDTQALEEEETPADATAASTDASTRPKKFKAWPLDFDVNAYRALKPGKERKAYLMSFGTKHGFYIPQATTSTTIRRPKKKPGRKRTKERKKLVPQNFAWPEGMNQQEFLAKKPGKERMSYLATYIRKNGIELKETPARPRVPIGRQPEQRAHPRCGCLSSEAHPELGVELTEEEEEQVCKCFMLAHRHGGAAATKDKESKALTELERVRRIKRATGYPSSDNIYRSNKVTAFLGDEGLESDLDDGVDDGPGSEVLPPSTDSVIPRSMTRRMLDPEFNPASYHPVFRSEGCSLLESVEPRGGRITRRGNAAFISDAMQDEICRGLDNYAFELDRNATMPSDDLVEFLVYMASIKSANVGELIGTFEDSAAVAASIVIEEYLAQIMEDTVVQQRALCPMTEESVQKFTRQLLVGFNWQLFETQHPFSPSDPTDRFLSLTEKEETMKDTLAALVMQEFVSTQPKSFDVDTNSDDVSRWIRSAIAIPAFVLTGNTETQSSTGEDHFRGTSRSPNEEHQSDREETERSTHQIRLSVKANPVHGNPEYKLRFVARLKDGHHVDTSVGGLDSKVKAETTISRLSKVVKRQERRSKGTLKGPPVPPGPPPTPRPLPPQDPNDPYATMFEHVWDYFNACTRHKWEMSMDNYLSATLPGWKAPSQMAATKRERTDSPQRKQKKRKVASQ
ncbi:hypothetical protein PInf_000630 [Phytophthora infestans]|nr:hypothetical protein PInf_000630 [Phytophthora infestans]